MQYVFGSKESSDTSISVKDVDAKTQALFSKSQPLRDTEGAPLRQVKKESFWHVLDFLYLFHDKPIKCEISQDQMLEFKSLLSADIEGLGKVSRKSLRYGTDLLSAASQFEYVKIRTCAQRLQVVTALYEAILQVLPDDEKGDAERKFELLSFLLLSSNNPMLLSETFEQALNRDADTLALSKSEQDRIDSERLGACAQVVGELREKIILQRIMQKQPLLLEEVEQLPKHEKKLRLSSLPEFTECAKMLKALAEKREATPIKRVQAYIAFQEKVQMLVSASPGVSYNETVKLLMLHAETPSVFSQAFLQDIQKDIRRVDEQKKDLFHAAKLMKRNGADEALNYLKTKKLYDAKSHLEKHCPTDAAKLDYLKTELQKMALLEKKGAPISNCIERAILYFRR